VFGKPRTNLCTNLSLKFGVLNVGEIEWQFFARYCAATTFRLAKKIS